MNSEQARYLMDNNQWVNFKGVAHTIRHVTNVPDENDDQMAIIEPATTVGKDWYPKRTVSVRNLLHWNINKKQPTPHSPPVNHDQPR